MRPLAPLLVLSILLGGATFQLTVVFQEKQLASQRRQELRIARTSSNYAGSLSSIAEDSTFQSPSLLSSTANLVLESATSNAGLTSRELCIADKLFQRAAQLSPFEPEYQYSRLAVQTAMSDASSCKLDSLSATNEAERIAKISTLAPQSTKSLYNRGQTFLALNDKHQALNSFRLALEKSPSGFALDQYVISLVTNKTELEKALPRRFPHTLFWLRHFEQKFPKVIDSSRETFQTAILEALAVLERQSASEEQSVVLPFETLWELENKTLVRRSDKLRQKVDSLLASSLEEQGKSAAAKYFSSRSKLKQLLVAKTSITDDYSPASQPLYGWRTGDSSSIASLYRNGHTVGFFSSENPQSARIQLQIPHFNPQVESARIEFYSSDDNIEFKKAESCKLESNFTLKRYQFLTFECSEELKPFTKVRYRMNRAVSPIDAPLNRLIQVYVHTSQN